MKSENSCVLSIIIVSWNTVSLLENCLASIVSNPPHSPFEIWVVDNDSTDESPQMVREKFPQVHLIQNCKNVGFARANNQAIKECTGKFILLLNPDTLVKPDSLQALVDFLEEHPEVGAAGSRIFTPDGSLQLSAHPRPTLSRELWRLFRLDSVLPYSEYRMLKWNISQAREVDMLMGACLLLRRAVLDQVGLLDEDYFVYSEEVDLCYRVQRAGWRLFWVPRSEIVHFGGQSTQQVPAEMFLNLHHGKIKYFRKHDGWLAAASYKLMLLVTSLLRLALVPFIFFEPSSLRKKHLMLADHYRRLVVALPGM